MLCLEAEIQRARASIRECGVKIRRFFREGIHVDFRGLARRFIYFTDRRFPLDTSDMNEDEAMIFNVVPLRARWKPPKYTFNDIEVVLTTDEEVEDGVVHAYTVRSPAWSCLPPPLPSSKSEPAMGDFQLFNRPMKMSITADDDDERLSLPSTMVTDQELKVGFFCCAASFAVKQMQSLLNGKREPVTAAVGAFDSSPPLSDDEGKGASLCSPADTVKVLVPPERQQRSTIPKICPPAGPPPPPPPPLSSISTTTVSTAKNAPTPTKRTVLQMLNKSADHEALPVRPSVFDLSSVRLKKTDTVR
ncbi:hypothetical protein OESDEN_22148 [Oesophagostomum dentatum]|uniref:Uncharacterized protein n=1 Tax=Oesophagostomum dentatum TaxID=61180 RepID=A0A0B1S416_OESDE|nr:hypothetical protein OESDEN_22148 [Oesophagostomum dentatum]